MTEQEKQLWYQNFTLQGRIFYPNLLQPEASRNGAGRVMYSTMFSWKFNSNDAETKRLGAFLGTVKSQYFPTIPDLYFLNPVKKWGSYQRQDGKPNPEFLKDSYWINLSSGVDFPPTIVDKHRNPVIEKAELYSGRNAVVSISFYKIDKEKKGAGANIKAVMLLDGGDKEGGSVSLNINEVFGAFAQDMGVQTAQPAWPPQGTNNGGLI